ncbi:DoxX family protein [Pseudorhodoplanes sp.]|uniref:DoxX family protein n=1 Tax=Pseudorhodoplanes sp. TaxID=1934341 RepID=UPI002BF270A9|nr:DoxX family protein [Pseudorhodoplanes sp.]HWM83091.1 DoxX family protein [Pseudolabrys sp.]HWV51782.1 DoxX family protein [Pseudorhodoplanes sp.]
MATERSRLFIPALSPVYAGLEPLVLPLLRVALGVILIPHGCQKLFGWFGGLGFERFSQLFETIGYRPGALWVTIVGLTEVVGGICLILGLFTRAASLLVFIFMINAVWFTSAKGFFWTSGGSEYSWLLLVVSLVFLIRGAGDYSIDKTMSKEF